MKEGEINKEIYKRYNEKRQIKTVSFLKEEHAELLAYANSLTDFSGHVRDLLEQDMEKQDDE